MLAFLWILCFYTKPLKLPSGLLCSFINLSRKHQEENQSLNQYIDLLFLSVFINLYVFVCFCSSVESSSPSLLAPDNTLERSFFIRMKSTLTKRGVHIKSSGYKVRSWSILIDFTPVGQFLRAGLLLPLISRLFRVHFVFLQMKQE